MVRPILRKLLDSVKVDKFTASHLFSSQYKPKHKNNSLDTEFQSGMIIGETEQPLPELIGLTT